MVLDQNMSIVEGSLGLLQRRILVNDEDNNAARRLLTDALRPIHAMDSRAHRTLEPAVTFETVRPRGDHGQ